MAEETEVQEAIEDVLKIIIDEWYGRVSSYYVTAEQLAESANTDQQEELKRFHDENGHRIKFSKDDLDFTYGLRYHREGQTFWIEVSVNNKVENFDVEDFQQRLAVHYGRADKENLPTPYELKSKRYGDVFELDSNFTDAFKHEVREGKADIFRLAFRINSDLVPKLVDHPNSFKDLVENFCVTPFRTVYASVYRKTA